MTPDGICRLFSGFSIAVGNDNRRSRPGKAAGDAAVVGDAEEAGHGAGCLLFTLVELVVAIGILVLMLTMAGTVFSLTLRSTGQAKALTDLSERLRMYAGPVFAYV